MPRLLATVMTAVVGAITSQTLVPTSYWAGVPILPDLQLQLPKQNRAGGRNILIKDNEM